MLVIILILIAQIYIDKITNLNSDPNNFGNILNFKLSFRFLRVKKFNFVFVIYSDSGKHE